MSSQLSILSLMQTPLPSKTVQRRCNYRPTRQQIYDIYNLINESVFDSKLTYPSITIRTMKEWGWFYAFPDKRGKIKITNKLFCIQWFILILAHEMTHQFQWQFTNDGLAHTEFFHSFKDKLKNIGIPLGEAYDPIAWFNTQDLFKV